MKKIHLLLLILALFSVTILPTMAQVNEPDFVGEAYLLKADGSYVQLDKEIGDFTSGILWSSNSFNALSLEIAGGGAQSRLSSREPLQLVVRAVDNQSDPLTK